MTEVVKTGKYSETLKAKCNHDDKHVIIKRLVPSPGMKMSTLKSYILQVSCPSTHLEALRLRLVASC